MITGVLTEFADPVITFQVRAAGNEWRSIEAVVDTGFNDYLALPPDLVAELQLTYFDSGYVQMADGSVHSVGIYHVQVQWDERILVVYVHAEGATPLVGMALLRGYNLSIDVEDGGAVQITSLIGRQS